MSHTASKEVCADPATEPDPAAEQETPGSEPAGRPAVPGLEFKRILVPVDFSECSSAALAFALSFADQFHARLILLHVIEPTGQHPAGLGLTAGADLLNQKLLKSGRDRLGALIRKRLAGFPDVEAVVRIGHAAAEIRDTARAMQIDLIIAGIQGGALGKQPAFENTTERIVRQASCPVLTIHPTPRGA